MALRVGFEPTAYRLTAGCSTVELPKNICYRTSNDLLSQAVSRQVPSALEDFTSVFGMGTGVTPPPLSLDLVTITEILVSCNCNTQKLVSEFSYSFLKVYSLLIHFKTTQQNISGQDLDLLVSLSLKHYCSYTCDLSTR